MGEGMIGSVAFGTYCQLMLPVLYLPPSYASRKGSAINCKLLILRWPDCQLMLPVTANLSFKGQPDPDIVAAGINLDYQCDVITMKEQSTKEKTQWTPQR